MASSTNLLDLPLEVLDIVFTNLSFDDKLKLGRADKNLEAAFKFHIRDNYTKISSRTLPTEYWSEFLMICGSIVNEIDVNFLNVHYFDLIKQYCCNLKIIKGLYVKDCKCLAAKNLLGGLKSLESLEVTITNRNTAKVLHALQELSSLKKLMIKYLGASPGDCNSDVLIEPTSLDQESKPFELTVSPNAFQEIQSMLDEIPGSALCKCFTIHIDGHVFLDPYDESDNDMMSISLNRLNSIITS
ncbi:uncharacterized protein LOC108099916 isoform X2 [Drosophila ficusphila]|uniref:uncharacterized protein LOC108099916 isoform X2 n=1 Tax=Drosophila ficusphila TaxID=30025 RepID=UPI0007E8529F|nr:uncharacterized protein LOC108099916 isoform X2 [Drosophila ficusphila]